MKVRPDFKVLRNPYGEDDIVVVPAISPDVAIVHAFRADEDGNMIADRYQDNWLLAQAARRVIVTVEEVVPSGDLLRAGFDSVISAIHIDAVVHAPRGAQPTSYRCYYQSDATHIREYLRCARTDESFTDYLHRFVLCSEERYLELVGVVAPEGGKA